MARRSASLNAERRAAELARVAGGEAVDVVVIGGGITGAGVALDAASRGLSTVLLERRDLANGRFFDSSRAGGRPPLSFRLGQGVIIRGLEEGVATMHLGGTRRLVIPPSLAFGPTARGSVPANSTIVINIELVAIS